MEWEVVEAVVVEVRAEGGVGVNVGEPDFSCGEVAMVGSEAGGESSTDGADMVTATAGEVIEEYEGGRRGL